MNERKRFPFHVEVILEAAGWTGGPQDKMPVPLCEDYPLFPAAEKVLLEFGGLKIGMDAEDGAMLADDYLDISPKRACEHYFYFERNRSARTQEGYRYYPLGYLFDELAFLLIDEKGVTYYKSDYKMDILGKTFDEALIIHFPH